MSFSVYAREGFLHLQKIVEEAIIEWKSGQELEDIAVSVRQIPFPRFSTDEFLSMALRSNLITFFIVLGFLLPAAIFCKVCMCMVQQKLYIIYSEVSMYAITENNNCVLNIKGSSLHM